MAKMSSGRSIQVAGMLVAFCGLVASLVAAPAAADVCNLGFEDGAVSPWVSFNYSGSTSVSIDSAAPMAGSYCVRLEQGTVGNKGGVYMRFPVTSGQKYAISAYCMSGSANNAARMRVDAGGGTDYGVYTVQASQGVMAAYTLMNCGTVTAAGSYITVFLAQESLASNIRYAFYDNITVVPVAPDSAYVSPTSVDVGGTATFTAAGAYGTRVAWYSDANCTSLIGIGNPYVKTGIAGNTTLYARNEVTCGSTVTGHSTTPSTVSASVAVACDQPAAPTSTSANPSTITSGQSSTLSASVESGCTVDWYMGSCGGTLVGSGTSLVVSPTTTTTYYPRARNTSTGCTNSTCGTAVTITIAVASVRYVKYHEGGTHDGLSWVTAFNTVQEAVDASSSGNEVWVAAGNYVGNIVLSSGVAIYGGFAGTETLLSQRNWATNVSVLDGDCGGSVIEVVRDAATSTRIDGLTITNGRAITGGGIYCNQGASPVIANNVIIGNLAEFEGGGIHCNLSSTAVIANNKITNNAATASGGGIRSTTGTVKMTNNLIVGNTARTGGGICCGDTSTTLTATHEYIANNSVVANTAIWGGGIWCGGASSASISNNIIAHNFRGIHVASGAGSPVLKANCLYGNNGGNYAGISQGSTDILTDPQLASSTYGNVHIQSGSPCRNTGNNTEVIAGWPDIDGQTRILNTTVDIGADESDGTTYAITPTIIRVTTSGSDSNNGSTWALAKRNVQSAIAAVQAAGGGEVWVEAGIYSERIQLADFVYVYGGFAGTETSRTQRSWATNVTIIDAGAAGSAVTASSLGYRISAIDGFTIRNGKGLNGAGVFCRNASPQVMNNIITSNAVSGNGGGVYLANSAALVRANSIANNSALQNGGGVFCYESIAEVSRCNIEGNSACIDGCGVYSSRNDSCTLINNKVVENHEHTAIGEVWGSGVGVDSYADLTMICNTVADNGPGVGAIYAGVFGNMDMYSNIVSFNTSGIVKGVNATVYQVATFIADPLFANRAAGDYQLTSGSACINAADEVTAPADDYLGYARNDPDIGCYEFGAGGSEDPVAPTSASATPSTICAGSATTLIATGGSGLILRWLTGSCDGTPVGTGNGLVVYPTVTTTYYARWETSVGNSSCVSTTVTVSGIAPEATVGGAQTIESGGTTTALGGNTPTPPATGAWSLVSGGTGTFSSTTDPNATFTHVSGVGPIVLRWSVTLSPCTPATADVVVTVGQQCLVNGGFDGTFTSGVADGWTLQTPEAGLWAQEISIKHAGTASQKITDPSGVPSYTTWLYQTVSLKPNRVYVPSMWIYRLNLAVAHIGIDPNGGTDFVAGDAVPTSNQWVHRVHDSFTSGSTGLVSIGLSAGYQTNSGTIYYDDVTIEPMAPQSTGGTATISAGQSATLTASGGFGGTDSELCWYTGPAGTGAKAGIGKTLVVFPTATTTYYPRWETDGACGISADGAAVTITVTMPAPAPTVTSVTPTSGPNTGTASITNLAGTGFLTGATVKLTKTGQGEITATGVSVVSAAQITCSFDLMGRNVGLWDVVVTNPDAQYGTLAGAFAVTIADSAPVVGTTIGRLLDSVATSAVANRQFRVWGEVELVDSWTFWLDDGSGTRIKVFAPGYTGLVTGDFASAMGTVDLSQSPPMLLSKPAQVLEF